MNSLKTRYYLYNFFIQFSFLLFVEMLYRSIDAFRYSFSGCSLKFRYSKLQIYLSFLFINYQSKLLFKRGQMECRLFGQVDNSIIY